MSILALVMSICICKSFLEFIIFQNNSATQVIQVLLKDCTKPVYVNDKKVQYCLHQDKHPSGLAHAPFNSANSADAANKTVNGH